MDGWDWRYCMGYGSLWMQVFAKIGAWCAGKNDAFFFFF